jgi:peptidoglycan/LPS O-acetylase OafA/YrhL
MRHRANLDILRALAVSCVLGDHLALTLHYYTGFLPEACLTYARALGHVGVLAFFVHTSLVLMYSLERMHRAGGKVTQAFYVRRLFRIYPLSIVAVVLAVVLHVPWYTWGPPRPDSAAAIASNLLLVQNVVAKEQILAALWSLPYEVQMYVVLPALFLVAGLRRSLVYLAGLLLVFWGLGALLAIETGHLNMAAYIPCFLAGVLCYALRNRIRPRVSALLWLPFLLAIFALYVRFVPVAEEPLYWVGWLFCLVLGLTMHAFRDSEARVLNRAAEKVALYSYGVYLLHQFFLYAVFGWLGVRARVAGSVAFLVLTGIAAVVAYHLVEWPCMELGRRLSASLLGRPVPETGVIAPAP